MCVCISLCHSVVLYADEKIVNIVSNFVLLECILAGEFSGNGNIEWLYNSQLLRQGDKYQVFTADNVGCTYYGKCHRSQLQIRPANANDVGTYTCSFEDMSEDITVVTSKFYYIFISFNPPVLCLCSTRCDIFSASSQANELPNYFQFSAMLYCNGSSPNWSHTCSIICLTDSALNYRLLNPGVYVYTVRVTFGLVLQ